MSLGYSVFIPHLSHFQHMLYPRPREDWLRHDLEWLSICDALLRLPGISPGSEAEVMAAIRMEIPVFTSIGDIDLPQAPE